MEPFLIVAQAESDWIKFVSSVGIPATILLALGLGGWKIIATIGRWIEALIPDIKAFFQSQSSLVSSLETTQEKQQQTQQQQTEILSSHTTMLREHGQKLSDIHRKVGG